MRTDALRSILRRRLRAVVGATAAVTATWLLAVLATDLAAPSGPGDGHRHLPKGMVRLPGGVLEEIGPKGIPRLVVLHHTGGTPAELAAWHTVAQCLILVTLMALVVAGLDLLRRKRRRSRRRVRPT
jgi:hypothetical protein